MNKVLGESLSATSAVMRCRSIGFRVRAGIGAIGSIGRVAGDG